VREKNPPSPAQPFVEVDGPFCRLRSEIRCFISQSYCHGALLGGNGIYVRADRSTILRRPGYFKRRNWTPQLLLLKAPLRWPVGFVSVHGLMCSNRRPADRPVHRPVYPDRSIVHEPVRHAAGPSREVLLHPRAWKLSTPVSALHMSM